MSEFDVFSEHGRYKAERVPEPWEQSLPGDLREAVPLVSIIIPVYNGLDFTRNCVESLYANTPDIFELVVVDNASDDGTPRYLDTLEGITIRNEINVGFPESINQGLTRVRGRFICLLNNDTKVLPGWLEPLLEDAAIDDVGSVGPLQLDGDGLIWHFGTVFRPDDHIDKRRPRHLYIGYPPDYAAPLTRREYPAMNFACCVSRKEIYDRVGELDARRYSFPGYFEDVDWMLRTRELGYRNLFEPRSIIIHYGSKGVATPEMKLKAEQARTRNIRRLDERWQDASPFLFQVQDYDFALPEREVATVTVSEDGVPIDVTRVLRSKRTGLEREKELLEEARTSRGVTEENPLVSILIPTFNNAQILTELTLPSVLNQTHENIEVVVVGDHCVDDTAERIAALCDDRITFLNLEERGRYPEDPWNRWRVAGVVPMNRCIELAKGTWLAPLDDDDEFTPCHVQSLLTFAKLNDCEFVYGKVSMEKGPGIFEQVGSYPPEHGHITRMAALYQSMLSFFKYDIGSWKLVEPADWNMCRRMKESGVRMGFLDRVVGTHYLERSRFGA